MNSPNRVSFFACWLSHASLLIEREVVSPLKFTFGGIPPVTFPRKRVRFAPFVSPSVGVGVLFSFSRLSPAGRSPGRSIAFSSSSISSEGLYEPPQILQSRGVRSSRWAFERPLFRMGIIFGDGLSWRGQVTPSLNAVSLTDEDYGFLSVGGPSRIAGHALFRLFQMVGTRTTLLLSSGQEKKLTLSQLAWKS